MKNPPQSIDDQPTPQVTFTDDDGSECHGVAALQVGFGWVQLQEEQSKEAVAQLSREEQARFKHWLETRKDTRPPPVQSMRRVRPIAGRAPRQATNARTRGSRRGSRASSSSSDDPSDPPPSRRPRRDPWALTLIDRAPILWRFRAARCRLLEIREAIRMGVDR
jgi:hypothetical protein